jgi:hypothetical protein
MGVWAAGAGLLLLTLGAGVVRLHWLALRARPLTSGAWPSAAADLAGALGVRRPVRLLLTHHPTLLVTWGWMHPSILLPSDVDAWPIDRIRVVLAHELAHIRRSDWAFQIYQGTTVEYSTRRFQSHIHRFDLLARMLETASEGLSQEDLDLLTEIESRDNIFPEIDYSVYRRINSPEQS